MGYALLPAKIPDDVPELIQCCWEAFTSPPQRHFHIYHPIFGSGTTARTDAIQASIQRTISRNEHDPTELWKKVVDMDTGRIMAAALWNIYEQNPYENWTPMDVFWWPQGPKRDYVNEVMRQYDRPLMEIAGRPHIMLKILFTHPAYRSQGAASLLLNDGKHMADDRGFQVWLSSWGFATGLYQRHGFKIMREVRAQPESANAPPEWRDLDAEFQPLVEWAMLRPAKEELQG